MGLFQYGDFVLNSGAKTKWKIDCDDLTLRDIKTLAFMGAQLLPRFGGVAGVPKGGLLFAEAMRAYTSEGPWLGVDDVLTTGASMERVRAKLSTVDPVLGIVIFARGPFPDWVQAIFTMPEKLWLKQTANP